MSIIFFFHRKGTSLRRRSLDGLNRLEPQDRFIVGSPLNLCSVGVTLSQRLRRPFTCIRFHIILLVLGERNSFRRLLVTAVLLCNTSHCQKTVSDILFLELCFPGNLLRHKAWGVHKKPKHKTLIGGRYAPTKSQQYLIREHGILMMWAVLFFYPCGIFIARYGKETLVDAKLLKRIPMWLAVHVLCMTLGTGLFIASMVIEVYGHVGWLSLRGSPFHIYGGGIMGGLLFLTFCHGWCVKTTYYAQKQRNWGSIVHSLLGYTVMFMGIVLTMRSETVSFSEVPCQVKWTVTGLTVTFVTVMTGISVSKTMGKY